MADTDLAHRHAKLLRETFAPLIAPGRPVALVDFPDTSNCGDYAVWLGEKKLLSELGAQAAYECGAQSYNRDEMAAKLGDGTILIHGGGNFGDRGATCNAFRRQVIANFPRNKIVLLPQRLAIADDAYLEETAALLAGHSDVTVFAWNDLAAPMRARLSAGSVRLETAPDMSFALGPQARTSEPLYDVAWIARTDQERANDLTEIATRLSSQAAEKFTLPAFPDGIELNVVIKQRPPTILLTDWYALFFENELNRTAMSRLDFDTRARIYTSRAIFILSLGHIVVTDRLHAHLLCLLMGIPHIFLNNNSGKNFDFHRRWTAADSLCRIAQTPAEAWTLARQAVPRAKELTDSGTAGWAW